MYKIILEIFGCNVKFETNIIDVTKDESTFRHFNIINDDVTYDFTIKYIDSVDEKIDFNYKDELIFTAPWNKVKHGEVLKTLIMTCVQWVLQQKGLFMIHASCVAKDNKAILLFGSSGAGKTSLAIDLCKNHGFSFVSNGSTLIKLENNNVISSGAVKKGIKLRYSSYSRMNLEHANKIFFYGRNNNNNNDFDCKKQISLEEMGLAEADTPLDVYKLYTVKIQNHPVSTVKIDPYRMRLTLHQDLSRFIRCSSTYLIYGEELNDTVWLPNMDTELIHDNRRRLIEVLTSNETLGEGIYGDIVSCANWLEHDTK